MKDSQKDVLDFWFVETSPSQWFHKNAVFDGIIRDRFMPVYDMARAGLCDSWMRDADGCLALCITLDQFPRNMFRNSLRAYESDGKALSVARHAIKKGFDQVLNLQKKRFIYLPFEHSEDLNDQILSVELFAAIKNEDPLGYDYALRHFKVIEQFGRFPHRNSVLARANTPQEEEYLATPGAGF
jgi:uncharacterized protein (DUF924 family)